MPDERVFILPGEMAYLREPGTLATLLGSCVAVCLHDRRRSWGGLNHYMVPEQVGTLSPGKVAGPAIDALIRLALMAGSAIGDLDAYIAGGAQVIGGVTSGATSLLGDIGTRNVQVAETRLRELGLHIGRRETGGDRGRRLRFELPSGRLVAETMQRPPAVDRERRRSVGEKARVLLIDDSALVRRLVAGIIADSGDLEVCGEAEDPFVARERILDLDPDVICLDLIMPRLDGLSFLRRLMQYRPIPTVVVSTIAKEGSAMHAKVLEAGALAVIDKEDLALHVDPAVGRTLLLPALRRAASTLVNHIASGGLS